MIIYLFLSKKCLVCQTEKEEVAKITKPDYLFANKYFLTMIINGGGT